MNHRQKNLYHKYILIVVSNRKEPCIHTQRKKHSRLVVVDLNFQTHTDMYIQGQTLQNYNNELVKCIEDLREKREEVNRQILKEEEEKAKIQKDLSILTDRLQKLNESLTRKQQARNEYDKTIQETEAAYMKILESSQTLLHVLKRESVNLTKRRQASS